MRDLVKEPLGYMRRCLNPLLANRERQIYCPGCKLWAVQQTQEGSQNTTARVPEAVERPSSQPGPSSLNPPAATVIDRQGPSVSPPGESTERAEASTRQSPDGGLQQVQQTLLQKMAEVSRHGN